MGEVNLVINGRNYGISCDDGQEGRVAELGKYVDSRLKAISQAGAASNEAHLLVLTALVLADEVFEAKQGGGGDSASSENEEVVAEAIGQLAERINIIADKMQAKG